MTKFAPTNLNFQIRFRLNDRGLQILRSHELAHIVKDGEASLPIWEFMKIFGDTMCIGLNPPISTNVDIEVLDV